jgi:hypothetical protein
MDGWMDGWWWWWGGGGGGGGGGSGVMAVVVEKRTSSKQVNVRETGVVEPFTLSQKTKRKHAGRHVGIATKQSCFS